MSMSNKTGNVSKSSTYLAVLKTRVELDRGHPLHHGIKMQAHHIISADGVQKSSLGPKLIKLGYDINALKNLIFLPSTLQGACHLGVQPHRGNHSAISDPSPTAKSTGRDDGDAYDDDDHPVGYHKLIARRLLDLSPSLDRECQGKSNVGNFAQEKLDELSKDIALLIYGHPSRARLTGIADSFVLGHSTGCAGVDSVPKHSTSTKCPVSRNHHAKQGPSQNAENIRFGANERYMPRPGK